MATTTISALKCPQPLPQPQRYKSFWTAPTIGEVIGATNLMPTLTFITITSHLPPNSTAKQYCLLDLHSFFSLQSPVLLTPLRTSIIPTPNRPKAAAETPTSETERVTTLEKLGLGFKEVDSEKSMPQPQILSPLLSVELKSY